MILPSCQRTLASGSPWNAAFMQLWPLSTSSHGHIFGLWAQQDGRYFLLTWHSHFFCKMMTVIRTVRRKEPRALAQDHVHVNVCQACMPIHSCTVFHRCTRQPEPPLSPCPLGACFHAKQDQPCGGSSTWTIYLSAVYFMHMCLSVVLSQWHSPPPPPPPALGFFARNRGLLVDLHWGRGNMRGRPSPADPQTAPPPHHLRERNFGAEPGYADLPSVGAVAAAVAG